MNSYSWVKSLLLSLFLLIPSDCCYALSRHTYLMNQQNERIVFLQKSVAILSFFTIFFCVACFALYAKNRKLQNQPVFVGEEDPELDEIVDVRESEYERLKTDNPWFFQKIKEQGYDGNSFEEVFILLNESDFFNNKLEENEESDGGGACDRCNLFKQQLDVEAGLRIQAESNNDIYKEVNSELKRKNKTLTEQVNNYPCDLT